MRAARRQGGGLAEMTAHRRARPRRLHRHDRGLRRHRDGAVRWPDGLRPRSRRTGRPRGAHGPKASATARKPLLVSVRSGAVDLDAGDDGHDPQPRHERRRGRGARRRAGRRALRAGTPTAASCRCTARSSRASTRRLRARADAARRRDAASRRTSTSPPPTCASSSRRSGGSTRRSTGGAFPQDPREQLRRGYRRRVRLVEHAAREGLPARATSIPDDSARP